MRLLSTTQKVIHSIFTDSRFHNRLLHSYCALCGDVTDHHSQCLCTACFNDLPFIIKGCSICSIPLPTDGDSTICGKCLNHSPHYHSSSIALNYSYPSNIIIKQLKYNNKLYYSKLSADLLTQVITQKNQPLPECLIPVPLHPLKLLSRGYNQSELIAKHLSKHLHIPVDLHSCKRTKNTKQQTGFSYSDRQANLKNAFSINADIPFKHVALIDDVVTTGSTVSELAKVLTNNGVVIIEVWATTRTTIDNP